MGAEGEVTFRLKLVLPRTSHRGFPHWGPDIQSQACPACSQVRRLRALLDQLAADGLMPSYTDPEGFVVYVPKPPTLPPLGPCLQVPPWSGGLGTSAKS